MRVLHQYILKECDYKIKRMNKQCLLERNRDKPLLPRYRSRINTKTSPSGVPAGTTENIHLLGLNYDKRETGKD